MTKNRANNFEVLDMAAIGEVSSSILADEIAIADLVGWVSFLNPTSSTKKLPGIFSASTIAIDTI